MDKIKEIFEEIVDQVKEEGYELSNEEVDEIVEVLHPSDERMDKAPEHFPYELINKEGLSTGETMIAIDPITGMRSPIAGIKNANVTYSDILEGKDQDILDDIEKDSLSEVTGMDLSDEDATKLFALVTKLNNGEKANWYHELPESLKGMVDGIGINENIRIKNKLAKDVLEYFVNQTKVDKAYIDLQESLKNEMEFKGLSDVYADHLRSTMEEELIKKAEHLTDIGEIEKANNLAKISLIYSGTYTFDYLRGFLLDDYKKIMKSLRKDVKKFNRHVREFNYKYENSKFKINDISLLLNTIKRSELGEKYNETRIKMFIILITKYCRDMKSDDIYDHTFMYYTIKNILFLDHVTKDSDFINTLKAGLNTMLYLMTETEEEELDLNFSKGGY
ncbi:MAG: hypothetical protein ACRCXT_18275 [Paraclostridium sp.]